jgi:hypothetical protein
MTNACECFHKRVRGLPRFMAGFNPAEIPANGIYFLFEKGEHAHGGERIVRVGTHTGQNNLPKRLTEHLYAKNKDRSIFRKHIGRCLLRRDNHPFAKLWEIDLTKKADRAKYAHLVNTEAQAIIENDVTRYMSESFSFSVIRVDQKSDRLRYEKQLISTLVQCEECRGSLRWLGQWHPNLHIVTAGLWNIQGQKGNPVSSAEIEAIVANGYRICTATHLRDSP